MGGGTLGGGVGGGGTPGGEGSRTSSILTPGERAMARTSGEPRSHALPARTPASRRRVPTARGARVLTRVRVTTCTRTSLRGRGAG
eukprot:7383947-Prymnesium_polylepis.1